MNKRKLVVIGGDAAGMTAASKVRREQPEREIIVFERGNHTSYAACGMPYYIGGQVESAEHLIARKPEIFREEHNIDVRIRHEVTEIDHKNKCVKVRNPGKEMDFWEPWDDLLIATGASPIVPKMENIDANGVFALSTLQSGIDVFNFIKANKPAKAVVVGGGYIGIEMSEAFLGRSLDVTLIDMAPQLMATLDKDMADLLLEYMKEQHVKVFLQEKLVKIEKNEDGRVKSVITDKQTQRILGGQIVGFQGAAKRIDTIVTAVSSGLTVQQLMDLDLAYAPPFSTAWDPVQIAARALR